MKVKQSDASEVFRMEEQEEDSGAPTKTKN